MDRARIAQADTIHCIPWELLEDFCHWPILDPCVTVRRTVAPAVVGPEQERACSWSASNSINILLIVARHLGDGEGHESVIPSFALSAIQDVQKNLNTQQSTSPINLEMVRPGTYEALQEKLESTTREKGRGYFHMVHFDLHGRVRNHTAHLRFTDKDRGYDDKPASVVAELLVANGVHSVFMNACESATASKGMDANMGRLFAQEKVITTLAMSYKLSSSAAPIFLTRFYTSLLIERLPFSEAAGRARDALRMQRRRQSRCSKQYDIQDWFVPVVYMSNGDPQIVPRPTQLPRPTVHQNHYRKRPHYWDSFINGIHQWLSMVLPLIFRPLRTSSLAVFASRPLSRLPSETSPLMTCLTVEALDDRQRQAHPLKLNNFILSFEHSTFSEEMTFLHGPPIAGKSLFLDRLSRL